MRPWQTHDLVDLFNSFERGYLPFASVQFTNQSIIDKGDNCKIYQHDINWPTHMDPEFDSFKPGQFRIEDNVPVPPKLRQKTYQWEAALLSLTPGKCLTIRLDGTLQEANRLMLTVRNRLKKINPDLPKQYVSRSIKGEGKWKNVVVAVRIWKVNPEDEQ